MKIAVIFLMALSVFRQVNSATFTVSKSGNDNFSSVQTAINAAGAGDIIIIKDLATYDEQVTIDNTKTGLILRSLNPESVNKPVIRWKDTLNTGPINYKQFLDDKFCTYQKNGALRLLATHNVTVEGLIIDGGEPFAFGYENIFDQKDPLFHGNSAVTSYKSGQSVIRNCEMRNAYFGIALFDPNSRGVFYHENLIDPVPPHPDPDLSTGSMIIEKNRIHNNSWGIYIGDQSNHGFTVRFNLIYSNYHTTKILNRIKSLPGNEKQAGGAFFFWDVLLTPVTIHNNTFWNNFLLFARGWAAGFQHLIFNNIFSDPVFHWSEGYEGGLYKNPDFEMSRLFSNRMFNCIFSSQRSSTEAGVSGSSVSPYPEDTKVRWFNTTFLSLDPSSSDFLRPDWKDQEVKNYIKNQGWIEGGIRNADGSFADLGAIVSGGIPSQTASIFPDKPAVIYNGKAYLNFTFNSSCQISDLKAQSFRFIDKTRERLAPITDSLIGSLPFSSLNISPGKNTVQIEFPFNPDPEYGVFEITLDGKGPEGTPVLFEIGHIPCWWAEGRFNIKLLDITGQTELSQVVAGKPFLLEAVPFISEIGKIKDSLKDAKFYLGSKLDHWIKTNIVEKSIDTVTLTWANNLEKISLYSSIIIDIHSHVSFQGEANIKVIPDEAAFIKFNTGISYCPVRCDESSEIEVQVFDQFGNYITEDTPINLMSLDTNKVVVKGLKETNSNPYGIATFIIKAKNAFPTDSAKLIATLESTGAKDTLLIILNSVSNSTKINPNKTISTDRFFIEIIDLKGRVVEKFNSASNDLRSFRVHYVSKGIYLAKITDLNKKNLYMKRINLLH